MKSLKQMAARVPGARFTYRVLRRVPQYLREVVGGARLRMAKTESVFTDIYTKHHWTGRDSISGPGSDLDQVRVVIDELPKLFRVNGIRSMLDIPCGDFHWMKQVDLSDIDYIGADIVRDLIERNREAFQNNGIRFEQLNLITDALPRTDVIFCRDCLVHLSFRDCSQALQNICKSGAAYLLTTTFTARNTNHDIITGQWRTLNFRVAPFNFPPPVSLINENCTEQRGAFSDKSLGLWRIEDIRGCMSADFRR